MRRHGIVEAVVAVPDWKSVDRSTLPEPSALVNAEAVAPAKPRHDIGAAFAVREYGAGIAVEILVRSRCR